jgi:hypothetical protein
MTQLSIPYNWPAPVHNEKGRMLLRDGYTYDFDHGFFVRHASPGKVFSVPWVEDHTESQLRAALQSRKADPEFYFNEPQAPGTEEKLAKKYGWTK